MRSSRLHAHRGIRDGKLALFNTLGYLYVGLFVFVCLVPFWLMIAGSFTSEASIFDDGFRFVPRVFSLEAYRLLFRFPTAILRAYSVSIFLTIVGAFAGTFLSSMTAFVLFRRDFRYRNVLAFFFYFTMLFSGGLVPYYLLIVRYLHLKDTLFALLLPALMGAYLILLTRNFMRSVPDSILESAKIDGAGDFRIFVSFMIPLTLPAHATICLFIALGYWNDWWNAMLFIDNSHLFPLQYLLYRTIQGAEGLKLAETHGAGVSVLDIPTESLRMATAVVATGPIILLYPFVQKYFVKGLTVGAVKG